MLEYTSIKQLARQMGRSVNELLALSAVNDPFYAGVGHRGKAAEWFAQIWHRFGGEAAHLRRIHYKLVSQAEPIMLPTGRPYQNTENDWTYLCTASLSARYLGFVPFDGLVDRRNDEPMIFARNLRSDPDAERVVSCGLLYDDIDLNVPDFPSLPGYYIDGLDEQDAIQDYIVEVWIEKSTQNDWLVPLCRRRGVNLVVGIGEQSEIRSRELALRSAEYGAPVRILYLSDFDPGGRSMPKAVARKVEFTIAKFGLDVDMQLIPLVLTPEQCNEYALPRTPIKETERRRDKFEAIFGVGATELDALEALHPGEMARLVESEIDNFLDAGLVSKVIKIRNEKVLKLREIENEIEEEHEDEIAELQNRFEAITDMLENWRTDAAELWGEMSDALEQRMPDFSEVEVPRANVRGDTDRFVLFDSTRDYFTQMDYYNLWRGGEE